MAGERGALPATTMLPEIDADGLARHAHESYRPTLGQYLGANARLAFDTGTIGMTLDWAERAAGGADDPTPMGRAAWRASPYWREDLDYDPHTTVGLARERARQRDQRAWTNELIARRDAGAFETVLGFGAGMAGGILDPINLLPGVGPAWRLAFVARAGTRAAYVARTAMVGALEGAVGTAVLEPLVMHQSAYVGDEMSWADAVLDIAVGAALPGVVGAGGAAWASRGGRAWSREGLDLVARDPGRLVDAQADTMIAASQIARGEDVDVGASRLFQPAEAPEPGAPLPPGFSRADPNDPASVGAWVEGALKARDNRRRLVLGPVSEAGARAVRDGAGIEVGGYTHILETSGVLHVDKKHGPMSAQVRQGGDVAVTPDDYTKLDEVLANPDRVTSAVTERGHDAVWYEKKMPDGYWHYIEEVRTGRKTLALNTFYKRRTPDPNFGTRQSEVGRGASEGLDPEGRQPEPPTDTRGTRPEPQSARPTDPLSRLPDAYGEPPPGRTSETSAGPAGSRPEGGGAERLEQAPASVRELVPATGPYDGATARPAFEPLTPPGPEPAPRPPRVADEERVRVRAGFAAMLHGAGRPRDLVHAEAAVLESAFSAFAERAGVPVEELVRRYRLDIRAASRQALQPEGPGPEGPGGAAKAEAGGTAGGRAADDGGIEARLDALLQGADLPPERRAAVMAALRGGEAGSALEAPLQARAPGRAGGAKADAAERQGRALKREPETLFQPAPPSRPRVATGEARYVDMAEGRFVALDTGSPNLGSVGPDVARAIGREAGPIRLAEGTHDADNMRGFGEAHIEARHGAELRDLGFDDVAAFVADVSRNFDAVYQGKRGAILLTKSGRPTSMAVIELRPAEDGSGFWTVTTAYPVRQSSLKKADLLWEGERRSRLDPAEGENPLMRGGQSSSKDGGSGRLEQAGEGAPRGAITLHDDGRAVIELFGTADASTVIHEGAHLFTRMLEDLSPHSAELAADLKTLKDWSGAGDGPLLPVHHERIAGAFEAWIAGGAAPSPRLEGAFRALASFMAKLFGELKAQGRRATPEVEAVFARMLEVRPEAAPKPARIDDPVMAAFDRLVREGRAHPDDVREVADWDAEIGRMGDLDAAYAQAAACVIAGLGAVA